MSAVTTEHANGVFPVLMKEEDELVEREVRDRFKKMCEGYFDNVSKKLVIEHKARVSLAVAILSLCLPCSSAFCI